MNLSPEDLATVRAAVVGALAQRGVLGALRARLRAAVLGVARDDLRLVESAIPARALSDVSDDDAVTMMLVHDYLEKRGLRESAGVLEAEGNIAALRNDPARRGVWATVGTDANRRPTLEDIVASWRGRTTKEQHEDPPATSRHPSAGLAAETIRTLGTKTATVSSPSKTVAAGPAMGFVPQAPPLDCGEDVESLDFSDRTATSDASWSDVEVVDASLHERMKSGTSKAPTIPKVETTFSHPTTSNHAVSIPLSMAKPDTNSEMDVYTFDDDDTF